MDSLLIFADGEPGYMSLMRAPITGGPAQSLLRKQGFVFSFCARSPMNECVVAEDDRKQVIFSRLDPVQGKGRELARVTYDPLGGFEWDLSDGSRVALLRRQPHGPIRIVSLRGEQERDIPVSWRGTLQTMNWSADGKGWYVGRSPEESLTSSLLTQTVMLRFFGIKQALLASRLYPPLMVDVSLSRNGPPLTMSG